MIFLKKVTNSLSRRGWSVYMIYCCGGYYNPSQTVFLLPDNNYRDRKLEIVICPKCGALVAELVQFNVQSQKYESFRPKRKKTAKFLQEVQDGGWKEVKVPFATKERAGFVFGLNKEMKNGTIKQFSVDFNGQKRLVKVIEK